MHQSDDEVNNRASDGIYYGCVSEDIPLPLLTFAPELCDGGVMKFDGKTDVWAFGITLIELYQLGARPYGYLESTIDIMLFVRTGNIHAKPKFCPDAVYDGVIKACLSQKRDRPIISVVLRGLQLLMETHEVNKPRISGNSNIPQPMNQGYDRFLVPDQPSSNGSYII